MSKTVQMVERSKLSEWLGWEIPTLKELESNETTLLEFLDSTCFVRPGHCFFLRKLFEERVGSKGTIVVPESWRDKRNRTTYAGVVLRSSDIECDDNDANKAMPLIQRGDVIMFTPDKSPIKYEAIKRKENDLYIMHMGDMDTIFKIKENY